MNRLKISSPSQFDEALKSGAFETTPAAVKVLLSDLPVLTALPRFPAATVLWLEDLPGLTSLPDLPAAIDIEIENLPGIRR